jgi:GNAT superfamily N-acetyltransferase
MGAIVRLSAAELAESATELAELLRDAVDGGASIGFLAPLRVAEAVAWWEGLAPAVADERVIVWAARDEHEILGTVQLRLVDAPNGRHRAEIAKLIVHRAARGQGIGRELLAVAEKAAAEAGRTLLILDTQTGSPAEQLYRRAGWTPIGIVPDYAADPAGRLWPSTFFFKAFETLG